MMKLDFQLILSIDSFEALLACLIPRCSFGTPVLVLYPGARFIPRCSFGLLDD